MPVRIVTEGVLTRSVRDTAHFYANVERTFRNPKLPPIGLVSAPGTRRLRVGVVVDSVTGHRTDDETRAAIAASAKLLEGLGHHVEEMILPDVLEGFASDFTIYWGMLAFMSGKFGKQLVSSDFDASRLDNLSRGLAGFFKRNMLQLPLVLYRLQRSAEHYAQVFRRYDLVLSPVVATTTPRLGELSPAQDFEQLFERLTRFVAFTPLNNATGGPAIALPAAMSRGGLPIGVHLSAAHGAERTLLEVAYELEEAAPWRAIHRA
jgi:amidase